MFPNGPDLNEAFIADHLDIGIYGDTPAVVAHAQGFQGKLLGFDCVGMNTWLLTPKAGIKTVEELPGQSRWRGSGLAMHRFVLGLLRQHGFEPAGVKVVHMLPRDGAPALERGDVAAFAAPINETRCWRSKAFRFWQRLRSIRRCWAHRSFNDFSPKLLCEVAAILSATWGRARSIALGRCVATAQRIHGVSLPRPAVSRCLRSKPLCGIE